LFNRRRMAIETTNLAQPLTTLKKCSVRTFFSALGWASVNRPVSRTQSRKMAAVWTMLVKLVDIGSRWRWRQDLRFMLDSLPADLPRRPCVFWRRGMCCTRKREPGY